jgi:tetratricopeptide (TPR) repeat protein
MSQPSLRLVVVLALALAAPQGRGSDRLFDARYERAVWLYAQGRHVEAVRDLSDVPWDAIDAAWKVMDLRVRALRSCPDCPDDVLDAFPLRAAAMLHFDADVAARGPNVIVEQVPTCSGRHGRRASDFARLLATRPGSGDFSRRFHLAMAQRAQWDACLDEALDWWLRDGLALFPDDPELLLTRGASHEKQARLTDRSPLPDLRAARDALAAAVAAAPGHALARIHLGRVQWQLDRLDEARQALEPATREEVHARTRYLAFVTLGQVHESAGRTDEAEAAFRAALALEPDAQAAAMALAHVLLLRGATAEAHRVAERALARRPESFDPQWNYFGGNAAGVEELVDALRAESAR